MVAAGSLANLLRQSPREHKYVIMRDRPLYILILNMKAIILGLSLSVGFALLSNESIAQTQEEPVQTITNAIIILKNVRVVNGDSFCCGSMVQTVNCLRRLGKADAIKALQLYLREYGGEGIVNQHIALICRLLFVNPTGWKQPRWGEPSPDVNQHVSDKYPLFPIALSRGVPFLLVNGYSATGYTDDTGDKCVQFCLGLSLIEHDLPEIGYEDAAYALVKSEDFQALYPDTNFLAFVDQMILGQARCSAERWGAHFKSSIEVKVGSETSTN